MISTKKFTPNQQKFLGFLRWERWRSISDRQRIVVGHIMHYNKYPEDNETAIEYQIELNLLLTLYLPQYKAHYNFK